jgi:hypothetical protein
VTTDGGEAGDQVAWSATVIASIFTLGADPNNPEAPPLAIIPASSLSYDSGSATSVQGVIEDGCIAGQFSAPVQLDVSEPAFSCDSTASDIFTSVSWSPTIRVNIDQFAVAGTYAGTITHSVA